MNNFDFLNKFLDLQNKISYTDIFEYGFARTTYAKDDRSIFANFSLINKVLTNEQLKKLELLYKKVDRKLSLYFENSLRLLDLKSDLEYKGFKKQFEDSWMFYSSDDKPNVNKDREIIKVANENDLKTFIEVFDNSYQKGDPQNPYGDVKNFIPSTIRSWREFGKSGRIEYFVVFKDGLPGAVSALNNYHGIGYISCVGSLRIFRGQGLGKAATLYATKKSFENGNEIHCLATEEGTYPNTFYKRIGFETRFTAIQMAKEKQ